MIDVAIGPEIDEDLSVAALLGVSEDDLEALPRVLLMRNAPSSAATA